MLEQVCESLTDFIGALRVQNAAHNSIDSITHSRKKTIHNKVSTVQVFVQFCTQGLVRYVTYFFTMS